MITLIPTQKMVIKIFIILFTPANYSQIQFIKGIVGAEPIVSLTTMLAIDITLI